FIWVLILTSCLELTGQKDTSLQSRYLSNTSSGSSQRPSCLRNIYSPSLLTLGQYMSLLASYVVSSNISMPISSAIFLPIAWYSSGKTGLSRGIISLNLGLVGS